MPVIHPLSTPWQTAGAIVVSALVGAIIGFERRSIGKTIGVRTFASVALVATLAGWQSLAVVYGVIAALIPLTVGLNVISFARDRSLEMTTSIAMFVTALLGILVARGQLIPAAGCAVVMTALLRWKEPLSGFASAVTLQEIRGALIVGVIGFVVYPLLPIGAVDPWGLMNVRDAWIGVLAISGVGFLNYIVLRLWGARGVAWTGLLGGFVNSRAVAVELATRARADPRLWPFALFGILAANVAMVMRNMLILTALAPATWRWSATAFACMLATSATLALIARRRARHAVDLKPGTPVALRHVLAFGVIFLMIGTAGDLAQRILGHTGFLIVTVVGGLVSSASSVVATAVLAVQGKVPADIAAYAVILASMTTLATNIPAVQIAGKDHSATLRLAYLSAITVLAGIIGTVVPAMLRH